MTKIKNFLMIITLTEDICIYLKLRDYFQDEEGDDDQHNLILPI